MCDADNFDLSSEDIIKLGEIAAMSDQSSIKTRLAIIVNSALAYGLSRMYAIYRSLNPKTTKEVDVFRNRADGLAWLKHRAEDIDLE